MPLPVKLRKEKNAIKEAAIALFLSSPIIKPSRFQEIIKDKELQDFFQQYDTIGEVKFNFSNKKGVISKPEHIHNADVGFKALRFVDGQVDFALQGINSDDQSSFSFHQLNYHRWTDFIEAYSKTLNAIERIQTEIFVSGISLHYVDEFLWTGNDAIDLSKVLTAKDYLPSNFISTKGGQLTNVREITTKDGSKAFDRLEVKLSTSISKTITISHNQSVQFQISDLAEVKNDQAKSKLLEYLNEFHSNNKKFLSDILLPDIKKLIGLEQ